MWNFGTVFPAPPHERALAVLRGWFS